MDLLSVLSDILESASVDAISGFPGYTLATILRQLAARGYDGKGRQGAFTPQQIGQIRRLLNEYSLEKNVENRRIYYRGFKGNRY
jgi:hypothetical protein